MSRSKSNTKTTHPPYQEMICQAVMTLKERTGSSVPAISKFISANYKGVIDSKVKTELKRMVTKGQLTKNKNSFKLSAGMKDAINKLQKGTSKTGKSSNKTEVTKKPPVKKTPVKKPPVKKPPAKTTIKKTPSIKSKPQNKGKPLASAPAIVKKPSKQAIPKGKPAPRKAAPPKKAPPSKTPPKKSPPKKTPPKKPPPKKAPPKKAPVKKPSIKSKSKPITRRNTR